jgi:2-oxoglutarate ferredoxin oxidoreductase subunit alpha
MVVLCPSTVSECFSLTIQAFNLAERLRTPIILLADKEVCTTLTTVELNGDDIPLETRHLAEPDAFTPYRFAPSAAIPDFAAIGGPQIMRVTGSSHDERGQLTKNPATVGRLNQHLRAKIESRRDELELVAADVQSGAQTLVVSYGTTAGAMREAADQARSSGMPVSTLTIHSLWPVPEQAILSALRGVRRVVVAELNLGQYRREIERLAPDREVVGVNRVDGELIAPEEILEAIRG